MGGVIRTVFGGSKQKQSSSSTQESGNYFKDDLKNAFMPTTESTGMASTALGKLLGLSGDRSQALQDFRNTPGYQFNLESGSNAIGGQFANRGVFDSGATRKALMKFGSGLADNTQNSYIQNLLGLGQLGTQAGGLVADAGRYATGSSTGQGGGTSSTGGLGSFLGAILSDRRTKTDIRHVFTLDNGLPVYEFLYKNSNDIQIGVMADEVENLLPEALGPEIDGYKTVNYNKVLSNESSINPGS